MKTHTNILAVASVSLLFFAVTTPTHAETRSTIDRTGANSSNQNNSTQSFTVTDSTTNTANTTNTTNLNLSTGGNTANNNTGGSTADSGNITAAVENENVSNLNTNTNTQTTTTVTGNDAPITTTISNTGANSTNTNNVSQSASTVFNRTNNATISNNTNVNASTGGNAANNNTGPSRVSSGSINVQVRNTNLANVQAPAPVVAPVGGGAGGGNLTVTPAVTEATPSPVVKLASILAATKPEISNPVQIAHAAEGVGGGYFPAGSNWMMLFFVLLFISFAINYADVLERFLSRPVARYA